MKKPAEQTQHERGDADGGLVDKQNGNFVLIATFSLSLSFLHVTPNVEDADDFQINCPQSFIFMFMSLNPSSTR